jgi:hypothetical protein
MCSSVLWFSYPLLQLLCRARGESGNASLLITTSWLEGSIWVFPLLQFCPLPLLQRCLWRIYQSSTKIGWGVKVPRSSLRKSTLWCLPRNLLILVSFRPYTYRLLPSIWPIRVMSNPLHLWRPARSSKRFLLLFMMREFRWKLNQELSLNPLQIHPQSHPDLVASHKSTYNSSLN